MDLLAVCVHEGTFLVRLLHDLVYHQLGVTIGVCWICSELNGDAKAIDKALIFHDVVRGREVEADHVAELVPLTQDQHHTGPRARSHN
jgi:hypothetical protein